MPRRRILVWHPLINRYVAPASGGLVLTVGYETVAREYADSYRWWERNGYWSPRKCAQEARRSALCPWRYLRAATPTTRRRSVAEQTMDAFLTHPANIPEWEAVAPLCSEPVKWKQELFAA